MLRSNLGENEKSFQEFSTSSFNNVNKIILQYDRNWTRNGPNTQHLGALLDFDFLIIMAYYRIF